MIKQFTLTVLSVILICLNANAQDVDFTKFIEETQISDSNTDIISIAWWIPLEFWKLAFQADESFSEESLAELLETLRPYNMFAAIDGKVGPMGGITYTPEADIKNSIELIHDGKTYLPIAVDDLDPDVKNLLDTFKPILKNVMGQMGENFNFYVFTDIKNKKNRLLDPYEEGSFELNFVDKKNTWSMPIPSLLPLKKCPADNALLDGTWKYCPMHGDKLESQD